MTPASFSISADQAGSTLAAVLRAKIADQSWNQIRRLIAARQVLVANELCVDPARRLKEGDVVEVLARPEAAPHQKSAVVIRYLDEHLVVVEKPAGVSTVRHPSERDWPARRKALSPTLEDIVPKLIAQKEGRTRKGPLPRLRVVQRLDKETSGLVVFARTVTAERGLGKQFKAHTVVRRYLAVIPGYLGAQRIASRLIRDRGDGRRGSTNVSQLGKEAITHIEPVERFAHHTLIACRLETGRTHQIRIHLAERGHPICGEKVYNRKATGEVSADRSGSPRLALHAAELGFIHPVKAKEMHWEMALPEDLEELARRLRASSGH